MLRTITRNTVSKSFKPSFAPALRTRGMADKKIEDNTQAAGEAKNTNPQNPSTISSGGAVGKQFNPDGTIGQIGEKVRAIIFTCTRQGLTTDNAPTLDRRSLLQGRCHWLSVRRFQGRSCRPGREGCRRSQQTRHPEEVKATPLCHVTMDAFSFTFTT